jgi:hypothetical protein
MKDSKRDICTLCLEESGSQRGFGDYCDNRHVDAIPASAARTPRAEITARLAVGMSKPANGPMKLSLATHIEDNPMVQVDHSTMRVLATPSA